jgi:hypothetical protein
VKRTYIDSCVLIAAATLDNSDPICQEALKILGSANAILFLVIMSNLKYYLMLSEIKEN